MKLNLLLTKTSGIYFLKNFHTSSLVYGAISVMGKYTEAAGDEPKRVASATPERKRCETVEEHLLEEGEEGAERTG
jgi:hypothetical protein